MKVKDYSVFAERLKKLLDERNISQAELARRFETTTTTVFRWTKGNSKPHKEVVKSIAIFLGVRFEYLNGDDDFKNEDVIIEAHKNMTDAEMADNITNSLNILSGSAAELKQIETMLNSSMFSKYNFQKNIKDKAHFYYYIKSTIDTSIEVYLKCFNSQPEKT